MEPGTGLDRLLVHLALADRLSRLRGGADIIVAVHELHPLVAAVAAAMGGTGKLSRGVAARPAGL